MYVYYSYVYEMEKHSFPPSQALTLDVKCGEDLVWPVNNIHFQKSKVKISVAMQDDAAANRSLSVWFFGNSFAEIAMASFKKVQEMLCLCLVEEIIDEEEFVLLCDTYRPRNLPFPHSAYEKFSLANTDPAECKADSRVEKRDIPLLVEALTVPPVFRSCNGKICDGAEGLCIMLKRFAYPCWYSDIIPIFGRSVPELSMISNEVVDWRCRWKPKNCIQWT